MVVGRILQACGWNHSGRLDELVTLDDLVSGVVQDRQHQKVVEQLEKDQAVPLSHHLLEVALVDEQGIGGWSPRILPFQGEKVNVLTDFLKQQNRESTR